MVMSYIQHRDPGDENDLLSEERREVFAILGRMKPGDVAEYARRNPFYIEFIEQYLQNLTDGQRKRDLAGHLMLLEWRT